MDNLKGRIKGIEPFFVEGKAILTIEVDNPQMGELGALQGDLRIDISEWREKRSLNANAYFHVLSDKLADATRMSKPEMKNYLLYLYGQKERDRNGQLIAIKTNADRDTLMQSKDFHFWDYKAAPDGTAMYILLKHSSELDSREMSVLIDGVIEECKTYGIETKTPKEIAELKARWNPYG